MDIRSAARLPDRVSITCGGGRTKQAMRDECDVNRIMAKFVKTGTISHVARYGAMYGSFDPITLQDALNLQIEAAGMFAALPAVVRKKFSNDAMEFLTFVQDEKNSAALVELGLASERPKADMTRSELAEALKSFGVGAPPAAGKPA